MKLKDVFERYLTLARDVREEVPPSFLSRMTTFGDKLKEEFGNVFQFYCPKDRINEERQTLLISHKFRNRSVTKDVYDDVDFIKTYIPREDSSFQELVHVALMLRSDLQAAAASCNKDIEISKEAVSSLIPNNLYLFLNILFGGNDIPDEVDGEGTADTRESDCNDSGIRSVAQDMYYLVNKRRKLTPKHCGLGLCVYRATRSRKLMTLLHKAGHIPSYEQCHKLANQMALTVLKTVDLKTGMVLLALVVQIAHRI